MAGDAEVQVVKRGETCIQVRLRRSHVGLTVEVKTHPTVEAFVRGLGDETVVDVRGSGRYWVPLETFDDTTGKKLADAKPLYIYNGGSLPHLDKGEELIVLNRPGRPILLNDDPEVGGHGINLSFLRLVGTSEGTGVRFGIKGVYTIEQIRNIAERIKNASRQFYISFLKPVDIAVFVSTQELSV